MPNKKSHHHTHSHGTKNDYGHIIDDMIDEVGEESFPTSDPPAWTLGSSYTLSMLNIKKNDVTYKLFHENQAIKEFLQALHFLSSVIKENKPIHDKKLLNDLNIMFTQFLDASHREKDEIIFSALRHSKERPSDYILHDLRHEHDVIKKTIVDLIEMFSAYIKDNQADHIKLIQALDALSHLYLNHIEKEEEYILPFIDQSFNKTDQAILLKKIEAIELKYGKNHDEIINFFEGLTHRLSQ